MVSFRCFVGFGGFVSVFRVLVHAFLSSVVLVSVFISFILSQFFA